MPGLKGYKGDTGTAGKVLGCRCWNVDVVKPVALLVSLDFCFSRVGLKSVAVCFRFVAVFSFSLSFSLFFFFFFSSSYFLTL